MAPEARQVGVGAASTSALAGSPRTWSVSTESPRPLSSARASSRSLAAAAGLSRVEVGRDRDSAAVARFGDRHDDDESPIVGERGGALKRALAGSDPS